jgi:hypothetical protein
MRCEVKEDKVQCPNEAKIVFYISNRGINEEVHVCKAHQILAEQFFNEDGDIIVIRWNEIIKEREKVVFT